MTDPDTPTLTESGVASAGAGGARPSPNIWEYPEIYEIENCSADPEQAIEAAMLAIQDWSGAEVLDLGCGSGFHLPRWARRARSVVGVEPHPPLVELARRRIAAAGLTNVSVREGGAEAVPLPGASLDIVQARWAYFFGPGCEVGLAELERVLRPGGVAFVIDNDATRSTFGSWFRRQWPSYDPVAVERFWRRHGWTREPVLMRWHMQTREDFEAVVRIEFSAALAEAILDEHDGCAVDYAVNLWWRRYDAPEAEPPVR